MIVDNFVYYTKIWCFFTTFFLSVLIQCSASVTVIKKMYIILIARVRVQYGKIFYEHAKYFHEPKASENVA